MRRLSGPGAALRYHLDLFREVDTALERIGRAPQTRFRMADVPDALLERSRLITASGPVPDEPNNMHDGLGFDGHSTANERDRPGEIRDPEMLGMALDLLRQEHDVLNAGETHYVSEAVLDAVEQTAPLMDPEPLFPTDLPCPAGLMVFERPILQGDLSPDGGVYHEDLTVPIRAIGWRHSETVRVWNAEADDWDVRPGIYYYAYLNGIDWKEVWLPASRRLFPDDPVDDATIDEIAAVHARPLDFSAWAYGVPWGADTSIGRDPIVTSFRRFLAAYFRWTWQRLAVLDPHRASRPERRTADRIRMRLDDGHIKVVRLRRPEMPDDNDDREWKGAFDHQFIVRGHWRRQWYRSLGPARHDDGSFNHESHRLVWVDAHIKGNPNGPLIVGHNVTAAVR